ncbi:MAG: polysaccharide deacetylase family protein, partial [Oscillibacter sp.]|nr:polysaccharide deacetylase family protein [Oscillibacter sp.]
MKETPCKHLIRRAAALLLLIVLTLTTTPAYAPARAAESKKLIAITFDDGPSANTPTLLDGLEARGAVATFFMCGSNGSHGVVKHSDLLPRMVSLGCQLANHSNTHPNFTKLTADQIQSQIAAVEPYLYEAVGDKYLEVVRIPGGSNTERIRANTAHPIIIWSIDPLDWRDRNEEIVYNRIMQKAHDGGVILLHDLYPTSIAAGLRAIDSLREQGYEFVTVSELFRRRGVYLQNGTTYTGAPNAEEAATKPAYTAPLVET